MMVSCMVPMMDETLTVGPLLLTEKSCVSGRGGEELELKRLETAKARMKLQQAPSQDTSRQSQATSEWVNSQPAGRQEPGAALSTAHATHG